MKKDYLIVDLAQVHREEAAVIMYTDNTGNMGLATEIVTAESAIKALSGDTERALSYAATNVGDLTVAGTLIIPNEKIKEIRYPELQKMAYSQLGIMPPQ